MPKAEFDCEAGFAKFLDKPILISRVAINVAYRSVTAESSEIVGKYLRFRWLKPFCSPNIFPVLVCARQVVDHIFHCWRARPLRLIPAQIMAYNQENHADPVFWVCVLSRIPSWRGIVYSNRLLGYWPSSLKS